ncbi:MAG: polysaccharide pyruvyl transferase family protein [Candidatus Omnitrophica bacterium]|nr:polysaccharide pyruvyl transferase family protein [Candidatus Omnitrophota bacterium]
MTIEELFHDNKGREVHFLNSTGNLGDALIRYGAVTLFKRNLINFHDLFYPDKASGKTLFVVGGGAYCWPWHFMCERVNHYLDCFESIFILPSSFDLSHPGVKRFIKRLPEKVTVFCREKYSYAQVRRTSQHKNNIFLDSDMAFHVDYNPYKTKGRGVLVAFRGDLEKLNTKDIPSGDISDISSLGVYDRGMLDGYEYFLNRISSYEEIYTDRAHVAIASALLGKKITIYPNNYHKVQGIYEHSLSHYPNVCWKGSRTPDNASSSFSKIFRAAFSLLKYPAAIRYHANKYLAHATKSGVIAAILFVFHRIISTLLAKRTRRK